MMLRAVRFQALASELRARLLAYSSDRRTPRGARQKSQRLQALAIGKGISFR